MARARLTWRTRAGRAVLSSCGALVALALIAGGSYWWGGPRDHRAAQRVLDEACEGVLPSREMRDVLGDGPFEEKPGRVDVRSAEEDDARDERRTVTCTVTGDGVPVAGGNTDEAQVQVTVQSVPQRRGDDFGVDRASARDRGTDPLYPRPSTELPPVGLGGGWRGLFTTAESIGGTARSDNGGATVVTLLDCARDRDGLLVTVDAKDEDVTLDDPRRRAAFARIATGTAAKASGKWGCDAELGEPPHRVALPVDADESVPLADASGTCRGVPGRGGRVSRSWESASGGSPVEVCVVAGERPELPGPGSSDETPRYHLTAFYGPYADSERLDHERRYGEYSEKPGPGNAPAGRLAGGGRWASAVCRDGSGPALFTVRDEGAWRADRSSTYDRHRTKPSAGDLAYERAALEQFARRSARAHGCEPPKLS
ncbi:hypothetical protein DEJ48_07975 [Streptomyces venezuelae]|uniref:Uncharacterized protein n=1 Tax=Streptomyces venezuelae TaxID=54571 RepID=A0A5P2BY04_STRVZ|nr:hypothetical protein [Streptomyces venezuelae]QES33339.1 hypothetical protein DEJ48_07975 [Streptomyces venezuelae]